MIKNIKSILKTSVLLFAGSFMLWNCESEADNLGSQFFDGTAAVGKKDSMEVIAYNINNGDTLRADASRLNYAALGAFSEPQFGMQKAGYVTQGRLALNNPDFGTNAIVDSVVLELKPVYPTDSATIKPYENYIYPEGNIAAKKVVTTYPIAKYGKGKSPITLNVHEVDDFLGAASDMVMSNKVVNYGTLLGFKILSGSVSSVKITKASDNSELFSSEAKIRVPLDKTFFQNKIIAKKGQPELSDAANFIRYFKGIRISVPENDGYIFKFAPNDAQIQIYYKRDVTANGTTTPTQTTLAINLGSGNVHFSEITNDRAGTPAAAVKAQAVPNYTTGDAKLYAQGMGGPSVGIKIPAAKVAEIRELYKNQKIGIVSAKIRLYSDTSVWNNTYAKPNDFLVNFFDTTKAPAERKDMATFLDDLSAFAAGGVNNLVKSYNLTKNPAYYDVLITQTFKNIIEKSAEPKDIVLSVGSYDLNPNTGFPVGQAYNNRAYTPYRVVLVGTDPSNANRAKLNIIYSSK